MKKRISLFWIFTLIHSAIGYALTDEEIFRNFQFSFVNPGARATAMGNAFIALADDATAAEANPAGLTILTKPEVSFEYRNISYDAAHLNSSSEVVIPDQETTVTTSNNLESLNRPTFWSFVYPKRGTTFAVSMQETVRLRGSIDESVHLVLTDQTGQPIINDYTAAGTIDQKVVNWNFSAARRIGDRLSVGASVRWSFLDWEMATDVNYFFSGIRLPFSETQLDGSDKAFAWNIGVIYRIRPNIFVGAVYKRNGRFEVTEVESGSNAEKPGPFLNVLKIPNIFGAGISIRPNDHIVISSDVVRVKYSDLVNDFEAGRNPITATFESGDLQYGVDDVTEFHIGGEFFVFLKDLPIAIRQGYYRKKSNALQIRHAPDPASFEIFRSVFKKGENENHLTMGAGVIISDFQVDWAVDTARSSTHFVVSTVVRF